MHSAKGYLLALALICGFWLSPSSAEAQAVIELINPLTGTNTFSITPGQTGSGSFEFVVSGLTAQQPLSSFSLAPVEGFSIIGQFEEAQTYTPSLPEGWTVTDDVDGFALAGHNVNGSAISGTAVLGTLNFTYGSDWQVGEALGLGFLPQNQITPNGSQFQNLLDANGNEIPYSVVNSEVIAVAAPEPSQEILLLVGVLLLFALRLSKSSRPHVQAPDGRFGNLA